MSNLTVWSRHAPFSPAGYAFIGGRTPRSDFDRVFEALARQAFTPRALARRTVRTPASGFVPAAELTRDGEDAVLRLELPGVDVTNDVAVELDNGRLTVRGEKRSENAGERGYREVRYGSFSRSFTVPGHVAAEAVTASYEAGVLTVRVAGAYTVPEPEPTATTIAITTAGGKDTTAPVEADEDTPET